MSLEIEKKNNNVKSLSDEKHVVIYEDEEAKLTWTHFTTTKNTQMHVYITR